MKRSTMSLVLIVVVFGVLMIQSIWEISTGFTYYNQLKVYRERGIKTYARVVGYDWGLCGKHGCSLFAYYAFDAKEPAGSKEHKFTGKTYLCSAYNCDGYWDVVNRRLYASVITVPIVYDPVNPKISTANDHNIVYTRSPNKYLKEVVSFFGGLFLLYLFLSTLFVVFVLRWRASGGDTSISQSDAALPRARPLNFSQ